MSSAAGGTQSSVGRVGGESASLFAAWWIHLAYAVACGLAVSTVFATDSPPLAFHSGFLLLGAIVVLAILFPDSAAPLLLLAALILNRLLATDLELDDHLFLLAAVVPMVHQLASLAAGMPASAKVSWSAVRPSLLRGAAVILGGQLALLIVVAVAHI